MQPNLLMALGGLRPRLRAARHGARRAWRSGGSTASGSGCPTRSTCSSSASKPASASTRRSSASARSWRSRTRICADELRLINLELRAGKARAEALHNLAERTGVDDVASLVAMLVQTDKFGTSVAQSLRVHSDTLRTKRRQRAEEAAAKTGVKMVFPLVFCIFPAIWVVTIGPAAIKFVQVSCRWRSEVSRWRPPLPTVAVDDARPTRRRRARRATLEETGPQRRSASSSCSSRRCTPARRPGSALADRHAAAVSRSSSRSSSASRAERLIEVRGAAGIGHAPATATR